MAAFVYNAGRLWIANNDVDGATLKAMLLTGYTPNIDTHEDRADINASEITGTGYTAGGQTLANLAMARNDTLNRVTLDADNPLWGSSTITADALVIYVDTGVAANDVLLCAFTFTEQSSNNGNFEYQFPANGFLHI